MFHTAGGVRAWGAAPGGQGLGSGALPCRGLGAVLGVPREVAAPPAHAGRLATPDRLLVQTFQNTTLPKVQAIAGVEGVALLIDRAKGRGSVGALYADRAALVASRGKQSAVRGEAVAKTGVTMRSLEEFEVVMVERV
ncbi:hypothetical protein [Streptomyces sp. NPDC005408]|uniref:hypothetical protein n=1 Tax=Streptomyces sp. NPDC005408 TaxID=3155341 RepID=UPI0033BEE443